MDNSYVSNNQSNSNLFGCGTKHKNKINPILLKNILIFIELN